MHGRESLLRHDQGNGFSDMSHVWPGQNGYPGLEHRLAVLTVERNEGIDRPKARFLQIGIHPGGGHTWMLRRIVGPQATFAGVIFGEVMDGAEAERVGLVHRCYDDDQLLAAAHEMAARAASAPRELVLVTKKTIQDMADIDNHPAAVERELTPQVWSTRQPWFAERIAALQSKISSKKP
jgi:enoyl-CoA hydratase